MCFQNFLMLLQLLLVLSCCMSSRVVVTAVLPGRWKLLLQNSGVSAMHTTLSHTGKIIIFDRTDYGASQIKLSPTDKCRNDPKDVALVIDCWAHSVEFDPSTNSVRPLEILTDTWCSSGAFLANGTLVQTGGWNDGAKVIRHFSPCYSAMCDWEEFPPQLAEKRWYASDQILPDDRVIVVGGRKAFSYEFVTRQETELAFVPLPFLLQTNDHKVENNLYPFLHLSSDGSLFIFANADSILLDYRSNSVIRRFPTMPGGSRNYPSSGSSIMLPLLAAENFRRIEIMICGGAPSDAFTQAIAGIFLTALQSCGRMVITDTNPKWEMETMPISRVMGDMIILPNAQILIVNGAERGSAGWGLARDPVLTPLLYSPSEAVSQRFQILSASTIARMYHSTANLLPDGRVLVGGSNTNTDYAFNGVLFPTELRLEAYSPYYLDSSFSALKPTIIRFYPTTITLNSAFNVQFSVPTSPRSDLQISIYAPPFTTHSVSMNQRLLVLSIINVKNLGGTDLATAKSPPNAVAAPAGYYLLFVVNAGIPSTGAWIQLQA